ncbi:MAG: ABC-2 family transporter protein [Clostridiales bacterium]|nr:ABC-2 family transporter protein [Clostridiales bacterium]
MTRSLKAFAAMFKIEFFKGIQYRTAAAVNSVVGLFWGIIEIAVFSAFYLYANDKTAAFFASLTLRQVVTHVWLRQAVIAFHPQNIEEDIRGKINNGDVGVELVRPVPLYLLWFSKTAASRLVLFLFRGTIILFSMFLSGIYKISAPVSVTGFLLFLVSLVSAFFLCAAFGMFVTSLRLAVDWGDGLTYIPLIAANVLSGSYLPLQLWPDFMQKFLLYQPFAGYLDIPLRFYIGSVKAGEALPSLIAQVLWTVFFIAAGNIITAKNVKNIIVQGG